MTTVRAGLASALVLVAGAAAGVASADTAPAGTATTTAPTTAISAPVGTGVACSPPAACGDGGPATSAQLRHPYGLAIDAAGTVYFSDQDDHRVRRVTSDGRITTVAGNGTPCPAAASCGDGGPATAAQLRFPAGLALDGQGNLLIADSGDNEVRKVAPDGTITVIAGGVGACTKPPNCGDGGPAMQAQLRRPAGVALDSTGGVLIADTGDAEVRRVGSDGTITTVAGTGAPCLTVPSCGDGGPATQAQLVAPTSVAVGADGTVAIADQAANDVRAIAPDGTVTTLAGTGSACATPGSCGDGGTATSAKLSQPKGVAFDGAGNLLISDTYDDAVRSVNGKGVVSTAAGSGQPCPAPPNCGDGGDPALAQLTYPTAAAADPSGRVWIADYADNELRLVAPIPPSSPSSPSSAPPQKTVYTPTPPNMGYVRLACRTAKARRGRPVPPEWCRLDPASSPGSVKGTDAATLRRGRTVYATGVAVRPADLSVALTVARTVGQGRYTLSLRRQIGRRVTTTNRAITIS